MKSPRLHTTVRAALGVLLALVLVTRWDSLAHSGGFDSSMRLAPTTGELFVGVDLTRLGAHRDSDSLMRLAVTRRLLPPVLNEKGACLDAGGTLSRNTAIRLTNGRFVHIVEGKMDIACTRKHFAGRLEAKLKKVNRSVTGTLGSSTYVVVSGNQIVVFVDERHALIGRSDDIKKLIQVTSRAKKTVFSNSHLKGLYKKASRPDALAWSFSKIPKRLQDRARNTQDDAMSTVRNVFVSVSGTSESEILVRAAVKTPEEAAKLKMLLQQRIRERVSDSLILRALGVASMVEKALKLSTKGAVVEARVKLSSFQTGILARSGGKILSVLE